MLTRKSKYGLKALLALAEEPDGSPVLISDLADRQKLPRKFLEAILLELKRHGLLHSKKGKGGGYFLGRKPEEITVGQVIRDTVVAPPVRSIRSFPDRIVSVPHSQLSQPASPERSWQSRSPDFSWASMIAWERVASRSG